MEITRRASLRASDADREQVVELLRQAATEGRLFADELQERLGAALRARTYAELDALVADLPRPRKPASPPPYDPAALRRIVAAGLLLLMILLASAIIAAASHWHPGRDYWGDGFRGHGPTSLFSTPGPGGLAGPGAARSGP